MPSTSAPLPPLSPSRITCTGGFGDWLVRHDVSLAFTSYQSGRLYLVGVDEQRRVAFHEVYIGRAMGLWSDSNRLVLATKNQIWRFENIIETGLSPHGADRHYVPRIAHATGDLDIHDIAIMDDGQIVFVNTLYSCLAVLSFRHSFRPIWLPPFISRLAAEDRCHLNGLAMRDGKPAYVTATSRSDVVNGWRARRAEGGLVMDVSSGAVITERLSMPHSPRWHEGRLWALNSGSGHLGIIDVESGGFEKIAFCQGFLRGLAFHAGHAIVALSLPRDGAFAGLALDDELKRRDADPCCGLQVVNLASGDIVQWVRLEGAVSELYDVAVLPGVRLPKATAPSAEEFDTLISIESN